MKKKIAYSKPRCLDPAEAVRSKENVLQKKLKTHWIVSSLFSLVLSKTKRLVSVLRKSLSNKTTSTTVPSLQSLGALLIRWNWTSKSRPRNPQRESGRKDLEWKLKKSERMTRMITFSQRKIRMTKVMRLQPLIEKNGCANYS